MTYLVIVVTILHFVLVSAEPKQDTLPINLTNPKGFVNSKWDTIMAKHNLFEPKYENEGQKRFKVLHKSSNDKKFNIRDVETEAKENRRSFGQEANRLQGAVKILDLIS